MSTNSYTIGQLAEKTDLNVETIRYYQQVGLIEQPAKPPVGYRKYPAEAVERLRFIRRAKRLGFSLDEILELIALGEGRCEDVQTLAEKKRTEVAAQIADLEAMQDVLNELISGCRMNRSAARCAFVDALNRRSSK